MVLELSTIKQLGIVWNNAFGTWLWMDKREAQ